MDKLVAREANSSRDESWKREREKFILGAEAGGGDRLEPYHLTSMPARGTLEFYFLKRLLFI